MKKIPSHYRQLKPHETIRKGDFYSDDGFLKPASGAIGDTPYQWNLVWTFWRRRHVKTTSVIETGVRKTTNEPLIKCGVSKDPRPIAIVAFHYNGKNRTVQVVKKDETYLKGLEMTWNKEKQKYSYQFKSYLLNRVSGNLVLFHYGQPL